MIRKFGKILILVFVLIAISEQLSIKSVKKNNLVNNKLLKRQAEAEGETVPQPIETTTTVAEENANEETTVAVAETSTEADTPTEEAKSESETTTLEATTEEGKEATEEAKSETEETTTEESKEAEAESEKKDEEATTEASSSDADTTVEAEKEEETTAETEKKEEETTAEAEKKEDDETTTQASEETSTEAEKKEEEEAEKKEDEETTTTQSSEAATEADKKEEAEEESTTEAAEESVTTTEAAKSEETKEPEEESTTEASSEVETTTVEAEAKAESTSESETTKETVTEPSSNGSDEAKQESGAETTTETVAKLPSEETTKSPDDNEDFDVNGENQAIDEVEVTNEPETTTTTTTTSTTSRSYVWFKPKTNSPLLPTDESFLDDTHINNNCPSLSCEFGFKTDLYGKPLCSCFNPCTEKKCGSNICKIEKLTETRFIGACYDPHKIERPIQCHQPLATGTCKNYTSRFYYNSFLQQCVHFIFTGCNGNGNNFPTWEKCQMECNTCSLPASKGPCHGNIIRYYFDSQRRECVPFNWGGCKGNENNFSSRKHCEESCLFRKEGSLFLNGMPLQKIRVYHGSNGKQKN